MANYEKESKLQNKINKSLRKAFDYSLAYRLYEFKHEFIDNFTNRELNKEYIGSFEGKNMTTRAKVVNEISLDNINDNNIKHTELELRVLEYPKSYPAINPDKHLIVHVTDIQFNIDSFNDKTITLSEPVLDNDFKFFLCKDNEPVNNIIYSVKSKTDTEISLLLVVEIFTNPDIATIKNGFSVDANGWDYSVSNSLVQFLAKDETITFSYDVTVEDNNGGTDTKVVEMTITGTNDIPVLTADSSGAVTEDDSTPNLTDSGTLSFTDVDTTDTHTMLSEYKGDLVWSGGSLSAADITTITSGFTVDADSWDYSVSNDAVQFLAEGETLTFSYDVTVNDGNGGTDTKVVDITITGTNDAQPVSPTTSILLSMVVVTTALPADMASRSEIDSPSHRLG